MAKRTTKYGAEYKAEVVGLYRKSNKSLTTFSKDIGVSRNALKRWLKQADIDEGKGTDGALTTDERAEFIQLRRDFRQVKQERDFLKKVSSFFARENS